MQNAQHVHALQKERHKQSMCENVGELPNQFDSQQNENEAGAARGDGEESFPPFVRNNITHNVQSEEMQLQLQMQHMYQLQCEQYAQALHQEDRMAHNSVHEHRADGHDTTVCADQQEKGEQDDPTSGHPLWYEQLHQQMYHQRVQMQDVQYMQAVQHYHQSQPSEGLAIQSAEGVTGGQQVPSPRQELASQFQHRQQMKDMYQRHLQQQMEIRNTQYAQALHNQVAHAQRHTGQGGQFGTDGTSITFPPHSYSSSQRYAVGEDFQREGMAYGTSPFGHVRNHALEALTDALNQEEVGMHCHAHNLGAALCGSPRKNADFDARGGFGENLALRAAADILGGVTDSETRHLGAAFYGSPCRHDSGRGGATCHPVLPIPTFHSGFEGATCSPRRGETCGDHDAGSQRRMYHVQDPWLVNEQPCCVSQHHSAQSPQQSANSSERHLSQMHTLHDARHHHFVENCSSPGQDICSSELRVTRTPSPNLGPRKVGPDSDIDDDADEMERMAMLEMQDDEVVVVGAMPRRTAGPASTRRASSAKVPKHNHGQSRGQVEVPQNDEDGSMSRISDEEQVSPNSVHPPPKPRQSRSGPPPLTVAPPTRRHHRRRESTSKHRRFEKRDMLVNSVINDGLPPRSTTPRTCAGRGSSARSLTPILVRAREPASAIPVGQSVAVCAGATSTSPGQAATTSTACNNRPPSCRRQTVQQLCSIFGPPQKTVKPCTASSLPQICGSLAPQKPMSGLSLPGSLSARRTWRDRAATLCS